MPLSYGITLHRLVKKKSNFYYRFYEFDILCKYDILELFEFHNTLSQMTTTRCNIPINSFKDKINCHGSCWCAFKARNIIFYWCVIDANIMQIFVHLSKGNVSFENAFSVRESFV